MKTYKIIVKLDANSFETEIEGESWEQVCDYVFGKIQVIDVEEDIATTQTQHTLKGR